MSKKEKIEFQNPLELDEIDGELTAAMDCLDETNKRIEDLLQTFTPPDPQVIGAPAPVFAEAGLDGEEASPSDDSAAIEETPPATSEP